MNLIRKTNTLFLLLTLSFSLVGQSRITKVLSAGWKFSNKPDEQAYQKDFDDSNWENVTVPHDWAIEQPFLPEGDGSTGKLNWRGEGWYRHKINMTDELSGKEIYLLFDGIMAFPSVYINGRLAGKWDYGYNSFYLNITSFLKQGENSLAIHVDTRKHDSRWYPGAGIYRKVQLIAVNSVHVDIWGTQITTPVIKLNYADVNIATTIRNHLSSNEEITVRNIVFSQNDKIVQKKEETATIKAGQKQIVESLVTLTDPVRWDLEQPNLYKVVTEIYKNGKLIDNYTSTFGVRDFRLTNTGLYINDKRVQIKGVNLHHDQGPLGAAFNVRAMERQIEIMKSMGCNAIRTSHNVPAPELLELCDKMGMLVLDEAFDKYDAKIDIQDTTILENYAARNIRNFIVRDRNHPSIFLWSVGNEMPEMEMNMNNGFERLRTMVNYVRKYDYTRPTTMVCDMFESSPLHHFDYYDVHSWNYGRRYSWAHALSPEKPVIITESASTVSTRGFYELPLPVQKTDFTHSLQVSSYDLNAPQWAEVPDDDFMWQQEDPFVAGEFVWTGFDYLGEPIPYGNGSVKEIGMSDAQASRSSYFGIVDLCGIPKDRFYLYKSYWKPEETTIHILPHWNWENKIGQKIPVFVYTNGNCAELFVNGKSQGMKYKNPKSTQSTERFRLMWPDVVYEPGEVKVVAYKEGEKIGESSMKTAGKPYQLKLTPDRKMIKADNSDLSYILIEAVDEKGNICPLADNKIQIQIDGNCKIAGIDNGDPQSVNFFKSNSINLFYGKAMLIVKSSDKKSQSEVKATAAGLKNAVVSIKCE